MYCRTRSYFVASAVPGARGLIIDGISFELTICTGLIVALGFTPVSVMGDFVSRSTYGCTVPASQLAAPAGQVAAYWILCDVLSSIRTMNAAPTPALAVLLAGLIGSKALRSCEL